MVQPSHCPWCGAPSYHMCCVDHELVATLEQVEERDRPVGADDLDRAVELDHRQPPPGRGDGVALAGVRLLADQQLVAGRLPGGQVDDGRLAGEAAAGSLGVVVMVSSVVSRAGRRRATPYDGSHNALAGPPELNTPCRLAGPAVQAVSAAT